MLVADVGVRDQSTARGAYQSGAQCSEDRAPTTSLRPSFCGEITPAVSPLRGWSPGHGALGRAGLRLVRLTWLPADLLDASRASDDARKRTDRVPLVDRSHRPEYGRIPAPVRVGGA
jgi:hypothetical protein